MQNYITTALYDTIKNGLTPTFFTGALAPSGTSSTAPPSFSFPITAAAAAAGDVDDDDVNGSWPRDGGARLDMAAPPAAPADGAPGEGVKTGGTATPGATGSPGATCTQGATDPPGASVKPGAAGTGKGKEAAVVEATLGFTPAPPAAEGSKTCRSSSSMQPPSSSGIQCSSWTDPPSSAIEVGECGEGTRPKGVRLHSGMVVMVVQLGMHLRGPFSIRGSSRRGGSGLRTGEVRDNLFRTAPTFIFGILLGLT